VFNLQKCIVYVRFCVNALLRNQILFVVLWTQKSKVMNNFIEDLKKYFEATPREKVLADWAETAEFDNVGPTVDEFFYAQQDFGCSFNQTDVVQQNVINVHNPKFSSGFFFSRNIFLTNNTYVHARSCILNC
jgi:hypothetical protein